MFRGRAGDDDGSETRRNASPGPGLTQGADPRSRATGKKVRKIDPGAATGSGQPRRRSSAEPGQGPTLARRGSPGPGRDGGSTRGRGGPSLPPLNQPPTGEIPKVGSFDPTQTINAGPPSGLGVFEGLNNPTNGDGPVKSSAVDQTSAMPASGPMAAADQTAALPRTPGPAGPGPASSPGPARPGPQGPASFDPVPRNAFGAPTEQPAGPRQGRPSSEPAAAITAARMGRPAAAASPSGIPAAAPGRPAAARGAQSPLDAPTDLGRPLDRSGRPGPGAAGAAGAGVGAGLGRGSERLQDTEIKMAARRAADRKPKEPNRLVLAAAIGFVVLAGLAGAYLLTRGGGDESQEAATTDSTAVESVEATTTLPAESAAPTEVPFDGPPTVVFDAADQGPLLPGTPYDLSFLGAPEGSLLQVVVDDRPQGQPSDILPKLVFPPGRHSLFVNVTGPAGETTSNVVEVYVLGQVPEQGWRVNLSSVDIQNEGWPEAVRQFDEYRAAGHENLMLVPLTDGYWNLLVGGFGEEESAAVSYCEGFGLAIPDQCFTKYFDPAEAPNLPTTIPPDTTAEGESMSESTETTAPEAMTESTEAESVSTTAAGG